jgi:hypothetical protein
LLTWNDCRLRQSLITLPISGAKLRLFSIRFLVGCLALHNTLGTLSGQDESGGPAEAPREVQKAADKAEPEQDNPQLAAMIQQHKSQYENLLQSELHLAILVAELNQAQREQLRETADAALHDFVRKMVNSQMNGRPARVVGRVQGRVVIDNANAIEINQLAGIAVPGVQLSFAEPQKALEAIVDGALAKYATPEQVAQFQEEREKRTARLKQVIIANIVTGLDEKLLLTAAQRQQLTELIDQNWNAPNPQLLDQFTFPNSNGWLPIADSLVQSVLTPSQQRVWNVRRNQHTVIFNAVGGMGVGMIRVDDVMFELFDEPREEQPREEQPCEEQPCEAEDEDAPAEPSRDATGNRSSEPAEDSSPKTKKGAS